MGNGLILPRRFALCRTVERGKLSSSKSTSSNATQSFEHRVAMERANDALGRGTLSIKIGHAFRARDRPLLTWWPCSRMMGNGCRSPTREHASEWRWSRRVFFRGGLRTTIEGGHGLTRNCTEEDSEAERMEPPTVSDFWVAVFPAARLPLIVLPGNQ